MKKLLSLLSTLSLAALTAFVAACQSDSQNDSLDSQKVVKNKLKTVYLSDNKKVHQQVEALLAQMTLEEKIGQMSQFTSDGDITGPAVDKSIEPYLEKGLIGSVFNAVSTEGVRKLQEKSLAKSRLKIPVLFGYDVIHGFKTITPVPLAESCSWDLSAIKDSAAVAARETAASGINWTFAPMVDIARDPRWGRITEGAGEDVWLGCKIAEARVKGFQGDSISDIGNRFKILACAKHFAAYGAAEAGRDYNIADMSDRRLREVYLPPFEAAKKAGVATFMTSFNEINGVPATANKYLVTDILRDEWGFGGFVVTDYTAINEMLAHGNVSDGKDAAEQAANAGIDMDMTGGLFLKHLAKSVEEGNVSVEQIDNAVRRILEVKFLLGLFEDPYKYIDKDIEKKVILSKENIETARNIAKRSIVLLKNDKNIFPIKDDKEITVTLIGPFVKDKVNLNGSWSAQGNPKDCVSLWEGLQKRYTNTKVKFIYAKGCDITKPIKNGFENALATAKKADVILVAIGEPALWSGEATSKVDITIPQVQRKLLAKLKEAKKPMGAILMNGRPLVLAWEDKNLDAIMETWFLGTTAGDAIADVVSGDYNPSGRLTATFPRAVGQIPIYYAQKRTGRPLPADKKMGGYRIMCSDYIDCQNTPLYPFGYGLSYTDFKVSDIKIDREKMTRDSEVTVSADVANKGKRDGEVVVQLYVRDVVGSVTRPLKELKNFKKIKLFAGQTAKVTFVITAADLEFLDKNMKKSVEEGDFIAFIGLSSDDEENSVKFKFIK